jgi:hypothetical protein
MGRKPSTSLVHVKRAALGHGRRRVEVNPPMVLNADIRRMRLEELRDRYGSLTLLNRALGRNDRDYTLGQILKRSPDSKTGKPRQMGSVMARQIEVKLSLPKGWMDSPPTGTVEFQGTIASAVNLLCTQCDRRPESKEAVMHLLTLAIMHPAQRPGSIAALSHLLVEPVSNDRVEQAFGSPPGQLPTSKG